MNTSPSVPTPAKNPLAEAWDLFKSSFEKHWQLYAVGAALSLLVAFLLPRFENPASSAGTTFLLLILWLIVYLVYTVHLTLTLYRSMTHGTPPAVEESAKRAPTVFGVGAVIALIFGIPLAILVGGAIASTLSLAAQELPITDTGADIYTQDFPTLPDRLPLETSGFSDAASVWTSLAMISGWLGLLLALLLPITIFLLTRLSQASILATVEPLGVFASIKRSWNMTRGKAWYIFSWVFLSSIFMMLVSIPFDIIDKAIGSPIIASLISAFFTFPFSILVGLVIFSHLKEQEQPSTPQTSTT